MTCTCCHHCRRRRRANEHFVGGLDAHVTYLHGGRSTDVSGASSEKRLVQRTAEDADRLCNLEASTTSFSCGSEWEFSRHSEQTSIDPTRVDGRIGNWTERRDGVTTAAVGCRRRQARRGHVNVTSRSRMTTRRRVLELSRQLTVRRSRCSVRVADDVTMTSPTTDSESRSTGSSSCLDRAFMEDEGEESDTWRQSWRPDLSPIETSTTRQTAVTQRLTASLDDDNIASHCAAGESHHCIRSSALTAATTPRNLVGYVPLSCMGNQ